MLKITIEKFNSYAAIFQQLMIHFDSLKDKEQNDTQKTLLDFLNQYKDTIQKQINLNSLQGKKLVYKHCMKDKTGKLMTTNGEYDFTETGRNEYEEAAFEHLQKEIELNIEPIFQKEQLIAILEPSIVYALKGILWE